MQEADWLLAQETPRHTGLMHLFHFSTPFSQWSFFFATLALLNLAPTVARSSGISQGPIYLLTISISFSLYCFRIVYYSVITVMSVIVMKSGLSASLDDYLCLWLISLLWLSEPRPIYTPLLLSHPYFHIS